MRSLNKTISAYFIFLLINIACVTCPKKFQLFGGSSSKSIVIADEEIILEEESEELIQCKKELSYEFKNKKPLDDFLHAFLNIKYETVKYSYETQTNEEIYRGYNILEKSAKFYYFELFDTILDIDLPLLPSPRDFCNTEHESESDDCTSRIVAAGCKADDVGIVCLRKLYFRWKLSEDRYAMSIPVIKDLSDEDLANAISRGSDSFQDLTEEELFEALSREYNEFYYYSQDKLFDVISGGTYIFPNLKDEDLLQEFYNKHGHGPANEISDDDGMRRFSHTLIRRPNVVSSSTRSDYNQYMYNQRQYEQYKRYMKSERQRHKVRDEYKQRRDEYLYDARFKRYGIRDASFSYLCKEYNLRQTTPKAFDNYYAMNIRKKIKESCDSSKFKDHTESCQKYLSEKQTYLNPQENMFYTH